MEWILRGIISSIEFVEKLTKSLWRADKGLLIYLSVALYAGASFGVGLSLFWLCWWALLGMFVYHTYTSSEAPLDLFRDYEFLFPELLRRFSSQQPQARPYIAPPRWTPPNRPGTPPDFAAPPPAGFQNPMGQNAGFRVSGRPTGGGFVNPRQADANAIIALEQTLRARIMSQDAAIDTVINGLKRRAVGVQANKKAPLTFMMTGPTGTGKTETAKLTAEGLRKPFTRYDMGNYKTKDSLWQLLGSPQGYVGDAGKLTQFVKSNPEAVILFDEIEKGSNDMYDFMLPMIDEGIVKDNKTDETVQFGRTMIFFTTNLVTDTPMEAKENPEVVRDYVLAKGFLRQELVARIKNIVPFFPFSQEEIAAIVEMQLESYLCGICRDRRSNPRIDCSYEVIEFLTSKVDAKYGARNAAQQIEIHVGNKMTDALFNHGHRPISDIMLGASGNAVSVEVR